MAKPQFLPQNDYAFNADAEHTFTYMWNGNQSVGNILTIRDNTTNVIVYSAQQDTLLLKHTVPSNTLTNGTLYNALIQTIDINGNTSIASDLILFYCYSDPILELNISNNQVIQNSSCEVGITYSQSEGEELQQFFICLYDFSHSLLYTSSVKYDTASIVTLTGLLDNTTYYIKAFGTTINNIHIETEYITIQVDYIAPDFYAYITVENRLDKGDIQFTSNLVAIEGHTDNNSPATYLEGNYVDTINGRSVYFDSNFSLVDDFTLYLDGYNYLVDTVIVLLQNEKNRIEVIWRQDINGDKYVELRAIADNIYNLYFSNAETLNSTDLCNITIRCQRKYFDVILRKVV